MHWLTAWGGILLDLGEHRLKDLARPERVFQVCHPDLESEFPPLRSLAGLSTNLPIQVTPFVGRTRELGDLMALIPGTPLLTLTGPSGTGTRHASGDSFTTGTLGTVSPSTLGAWSRQCRGRKKREPLAPNLHLLGYAGRAAGKKQLHTR